jgi:hypothetical protein
MTSTVASTSVTEGRSSSYCSESKEKRELHFRLVVVKFLKVVQRKFIVEKIERAELWRDRQKQMFLDFKRTPRVRIYFQDKLLT